MMAYRWCVVPQCTNTSIKTPLKLFVSVPTNPKRRKMWLQLSQRDPNSISSNSNVFMCEDHFNIDEDTKNYMQYKMGFSQKLLLTDNAVPAKFNCQKDRQNRLSDAESSGREVFLKQQRSALGTECLQSATENPQTEKNSIEPEDCFPVDRIKQEAPEEPSDSYCSENQAYNTVNEMQKPCENHLDAPIKVEAMNDEESEQQEACTFEVVDVKLEPEQIKQEHTEWDVKSDDFQEQEIDGLEGKEEGIDEDTFAATVHMSGMTENIEDNRGCVQHLQIPSTTPQMFKCSDCEFFTTKQRYLTRHRKRKHPLVGTIYKCTRCEYTTTISVYLNRHVRRFHEGTDTEPPPHVASYQCEHCDFTTRRRNIFFQHVRLQHDGVAEVFKCSQCDYVSKLKRNLDAHTNIRHNQSGEIYKCTKCEYSSTIKNYLTRHKKRSHPDNTLVQCLRCDYVASSKNEMSEHVTDCHTRTDVLEVFVCSRCQYETHFKKYLVQHFKRSHVLDHKTYQCPHCPYTTKHRGGLSNHVTLRHNDGSEQFTCPYCDFTTWNKIYLSTHVKRHTNSSRVYSCTACDFVADFKKHLMEHKRQAHGIKENVYKCAHCDYATSEKSHLVVHARRKHDDREVLTCPECDFNTTSKTYLIRHTQRVHGEKDFECSQCAYRTTTKDSLARHALKHEKSAKAYQCTECEYKTPTRSRMVYHVRRMHNEKGAQVGKLREMQVKVEQPEEAGTASCQ